MTPATWAYQWLKLKPFGTNKKYTLFSLQWLLISVTFIWTQYGQSLQKWKCRKCGRFTITVIHSLSILSPHDRDKAGTFCNLAYTISWTGLSSFKPCLYNHLSSAVQFFICTRSCKWQYTDNNSRIWQNSKLPIRIALFTSILPNVKKNLK